ncbi:MAG: PIN domain-containing protein [Gammaproteobacteria bacterium]|nr:PIN domain-containing protein [Gammaproteobacteria bacterium]
MNDYLVDTNKLIYLSHSDDKDDYKETLQELKKIVEDDAKVFITPLIAYEFLRKTDWGNNQELDTLKSILQHFGMFDIKSSVADLASELYRFDVYENKAKQQERNFEKHKFDTFHFATAKVYGLEILSNNQKDMEKLEGLYQRMQQEKITLMDKAPSL